jgi:hypothetical protein
LESIPSIRSKTAIYEEMEGRFFNIFSSKDTVVAGQFHIPPEKFTCTQSVFQEQPEE